MIYAVLLLHVAVALTAVSQLLLKIAQRPVTPEEGWWRRRRCAVLGYGLMAASTALSFWCIRLVPLTVWVVVVSSVYVLVPLLGRWLLNERLGRLQLAAYALILLGSAVFHLPNPAWVPA